MDDKQFKNFLQTVLSTIDEYYAGYGIQEMKGAILRKLNSLFFEQNPETKKYSVVGTIDKKKRVYSHNNCRAIAELELEKAQNMDSNSIWDVGKFQIEEVGQQAGGYEKG